MNKKLKWLLIISLSAGLVLMFLLAFLFSPTDRADNQTKATNQFITADIGDMLDIKPLIGLDKLSFEPKNLSEDCYDVNGIKCDDVFVDNEGFLHFKSEGAYYYSLTKQNVSYLNYRSVEIYQATFVVKDSDLDNYTKVYNGTEIMIKGKYILANDITLTKSLCNFNGTLINPDGYKITYKNTKGTALFTGLERGAIIDGLIIESDELISNDSVSGIANINNGVILNCSFTGNLTSKENNVSAFSNSNEGIIYKSVYKGKLTSDKDIKLFTENDVMTIFGYFNGRYVAVKNCKSYVDVNSYTKNNLTANRNNITSLKYSLNGFSTNNEIYNLDGIKYNLKEYINVKINYSRQFYGTTSEIFEIIKNDKFTAQGIGLANNTKVVSSKIDGEEVDLTKVYLTEDCEINFDIKYASTIFNYNINSKDNTIDITGCEFNTSILEIPEKYEGYKVKRVYDLFSSCYSKYCYSLEKLIINGNIDFRGQYDSDNNFALFNEAQVYPEEIQIKGNLRYSSEDNVIYDSRKDTMMFYLPTKTEQTFKVKDSVKTLFSSCFYKADNLSEIDINNVEDFRHNSILYCKNLQNVTLGKNFKDHFYSEINFKVSACDKFIGFNIDGEHSSIKSENSYVYSKDGKVLFFIPKNLTGEVSLKEGIETIDSFAIRQSKITKLNLPDSLSIISSNSIGDNRNLQEIIFGRSSTTVNASGIYSNENLTKIDFDNTEYIKLVTESISSCQSIKSIALPINTEYKGSAINACHSLEQITVHEECQTVTSVDGVLYSKDMQTLYLYPAAKADKEFTVPEQVKTIYDFAFYYNQSLEKLIMIDVDTINSDGFSYTNIKDIIFSDNLSSIGANAFTECDFSEITLPENILSLGSSTFRKCSKLKTVNLPDNLLSIGNECFFGCTSLEFIKIPENVTTIAKDSFDGCESLKTVFIPKSATSLTEITFKNCDSLKTVYFNGEVNNYTALTEDFGVGNIKAYFYTATKPYYKGRYFSYDSQGDAIIWTTHTAIDSEYSEGLCFKLIKDYYYTVSFYNGKDTNVILPAVYNGLPVKKIEENVFQNSKIVSINIPDSITYIGQYAFANCDYLQSVKMSKAVTVINQHTFYNCMSLVDFTGLSVRNIYTSAFENCSALETINTDSLEYVSTDAFKNCKAVKEISADRANFLFVDDTPFTNCNFNYLKVYLFCSVQHYNNYANYKNKNIPNAKVYFYSKTQPTDTLHNYFYLNENNEKVDWVI